MRGPLDRVGKDLGPETEESLREGRSGHFGRGEGPTATSW